MGISSSGFADPSPGDDLISISCTSSVSLQAVAQMRPRSSNFLTGSTLIN